MSVAGRAVLASISPLITAQGGPATRGPATAQDAEGRWSFKRAAAYRRAMATQLPVCRSDEASLTVKATAAVCQAHAARSVFSITRREAAIAASP